MLNLAALGGGIGARILAGLAGLALIAGALAWMRHDAYKDGIAHRDGQIAEANERWRKKVEKSEKEADITVAAKALVEGERVEKELERLDEAEVHGTSPFDVLFPSSVQ